MATQVLHRTSACKFVPWHISVQRNIINLFAKQLRLYRSGKTCADLLLTWGNMAIHNTDEYKSLTCLKTSPADDDDDEHSLKLSTCAYMNNFITHLQWGCILPCNVVNCLFSAVRFYPPNPLCSTKSSSTGDQYAALQRKIRWTKSQNMSNFSAKWFWPSTCAQDAEAGERQSKA